MRNLLLGTVTLGMVFLLVTGCDQVSTYDGVIITEERTITVDLDNRVFDAWLGIDDHRNGLGATEVSIAVKTSINTYTTTITPASKDTAYLFTASDLLVSGTLESVTATITTPTGVVSNTLASLSQEALWTGWETFANVLKFRVMALPDTKAATSNTALVDIAPKGLDSVRFWVDSGVTPVYQRKTDRGSVLSSGMVALEPRFREHPSTLKFRFYWDILDTNLRGQTDPRINPEAGYLSDPWSDTWTYEQITSTGRKVGGNTYKLTDNSTEPYNAINPLSDGYDSFLFDTANKKGNVSNLGKYLLATMVLEAGGLKIPSTVVCVEIK